MARRTIEVEETRISEVDVDVCDDCGREKDDFGTTFTPTTPPSGEHDREVTRLDFCSGCLEQYREPDTRSPLLRASEWTMRHNSASKWWWLLKDPDDGNPRAPEWFIVGVFVIFLPLVFAIATYELIFSERDSSQWKEALGFFCAAITLALGYALWSSIIIGISSMF